VRIVVLGAGISGLFAGLLLALDGHEVTLVEPDGAPVPAQAAGAWEDWSRKGVVQFRQPHYLQPRGRATLEEELPDVAAALAAAGALRFDVLGIMPPTIADRAPRAGDERFLTLTARRPVIEHVLGRAAEEQAGLDVRRGDRVQRLRTRMSHGIAHVTGVVTEAGDRLDADLVVDAMGRRSPMPGWIADAASAALHEEAEDSGFVYYSRFFRSREGGLPPFRSAPTTPLGSFAILVLPADNHTWSVTLFSSAGDRALKRLRERARWEAVLAACPAHVQWLEGEPLTDVLPMGGIVDRYRRLVVDGRPVITGVALLADAWACTNPSIGRGMSLAMLHARHLRDLAREGIEDPQRFALAWDELTETHLTPWYRDTVKEDRGRLRQIDAARAGAGGGGAPPPESPPGAAAVAAALPTAVAYDPDVFRAFVETRSSLATLDDVLARPGMVERILAIAGEHEPVRPQGPDRQQLLALLS
jgi:2-polyprenyl-6-methoxyphenol hydroxylase-like FAD-dependent oxidoreductase